MTIIEIPDAEDLYARVADSAKNFPSGLNSRIELKKGAIFSSIEIGKNNYVVQVQLRGRTSKLRKYAQRLIDSKKELGWNVRFGEVYTYVQEFGKPYNSYRISSFSLTARSGKDPTRAIILPNNVQIEAGCDGTVVRSHAKEEEFTECMRGLENLINVIAFPMLKSEVVNYPILFREDH